MSELTDEDKFKAGLIQAALISSGLMETIITQVETAIADGKVPIADSQSHKKILLTQAASTMAKGIEGAFQFLESNGYAIVKEEHGEDTSVATEGRSEPEGGSEREGQGISESGRPQPESSSEGSSIGSGGDAT